MKEFEEEAILTREASHDLRVKMTEKEIKVLNYHSSITLSAYDAIWLAEVLYDYAEMLNK